MPHDPKERLALAEKLRESVSATSPELLTESAPPIPPSEPKPRTPLDESAVKGFRELLKLVENSGDADSLKAYAAWLESAFLQEVEGKGIPETTLNKASWCIQKLLDAATGAQAPAAAPAAPPAA